jgi:hypothetical protein
MDKTKITALRMERQHLTRKANETEYIALYRDCQPAQCHGLDFGEPPEITYRADFNDVEYNRARQLDRRLLKGRFQGSNLGWIDRYDLELFAGLSRKPLANHSLRHTAILELMEREGPMNIGLMKEMTGMLVKEITPVLHRLQEAFLIYEDQNDGEWDRAWYLFPEMFPDADLDRYFRHEALKVVLIRFAYRHVAFDAKMVKSFYRLPDKDIKAVINALIENGELVETDESFMLPDDFTLLQSYDKEPLESIFAMHTNDFLVRSNIHWLKEQYKHPYPETYFYLLINGEFLGAVAGNGKRYEKEIEDIQLDLSNRQAEAIKEKIAQVLRSSPYMGGKIKIKRYQGEIL